MNLKIVSSVRPKTISTLCDLAYNAKLYHPYGMNQEWYRFAKDKINCFVLATVDGDPVGSAFTIRSFYDVSTFVLPAFRRKGIGSKMVRRLSKRGEKPKRPDWRATPNFYEGLL